jgi:hypothetical protein
VASTGPSFAVYGEATVVFGVDLLTLWVGGFIEYISCSILYSSVFEQLICHFDTTHPILALRPLGPIPLSQPSGPTVVYPITRHWILQIVVKVCPIPYFFTEGSSKSRLPVLHPTSWLVEEEVEKQGLH